jgi:hypothetical protein
MGHKINVFNPKPEEIDIHDIAHALAMCTRFNGHLKYYYSVAEHSIALSRLASKGNKLAALLHDASEAYLSDVPRPIKQFIPNLAKIDDQLSTVILNKYGIKSIPEEVKHLDRAICLAEADDSGHPTKDWGENHDVYGTVDFKPQYLTWQQAERDFLARFKELTNGVKF